MKFPAKRIWWIVLPAALAVLVFQGYWLRKTYAEQRDNFLTLARGALSQALEDAVLQKITSDYKPMRLPKPDFRDTLWWHPREDSITKGGQSFFSTQMSIDDLALSEDTQISASSFTAPSQMISTIIASLGQMRPTVEDLAFNYRLKLRDKDVHLPFTLHYGDKKDESKHQLGVPVGIAENSMLFASFSGIRAYLLKKMIGPAAVSLLIFLLIGGCIWILWRTILRQQALETMRLDLVSNMTHELKTPVSILHAINESLLTFSGMNDKDKTERYLQLSRDELHKLQFLIDGIMLLNKPDGKIPVQEKEMVLLQDVVTVVLNRFDHLPGVVASSIIYTPEATLLAHRESLITILSNLVDNAIKYSDKPLKEVTVTVKDSRTAYIFTIEDNGIGILSEHMPFLFDKFYRVPHGNVHDVKGYGLGLSYVKELVSRMQGTIQVHSTPGKGSSFIFQIPKQ